MLSYIQSFLEKHSKWLFGSLLVVIIVPFVFTIGSMPGLVSGRKTKMIKLFGCDLNDRNQMEEIVRRGALSIVLNTGKEGNAWMESAQGYAFYRLWLLSLRRELRLPEPSEEVLNKFIETRRLFLDKDGQFKPSLYNTYLENWHQRFGKNYPLRTLLVEDYHCDQIRNVMQDTGFVLPQESEAFFKNQKATYQLDYVVVKNEEPLPEQMHADAVRKYYDEHKENYRVDTRADVTLLFFEGKKYAANLPKISEDALKTYFEQHKHDFKAKEGETTFETVKEQVKEAWEAERLTKFAEEAASQLAIQVYEQSIALGSEAWKKLLDPQDVRCITSLAPYTKKTIPEKKGLPKSLLEKAFELSEDHFLSDPVPVKNGVVLLALNKFLDPYIPDLEAVREAVVADAKKAVRDQAFQAKVERLSKFLADKGNVQEQGLETKTLKDFTTEKSFTELSKLLDIMDLIHFIHDLGEMPVKQWTKPYKGIDESVVLFYCSDKKLPDLEKLQEEFKTFKEQFVSAQKRMQAETLSREVLEATMNQQP